MGSFPLSQLGNVWVSTAQARAAMVEILVALDKSGCVDVGKMNKPHGDFALDVLDRLVGIGWRPPNPASFPPPAKRGLRK